MAKRQSGAVLVMLVILIVVLIAVAALALDVGRLFVLRTEMQNAVDAAALAAAAELDGRAGAQARAVRAAKTLIQQDSHFSKVSALLGEALDENEIHFKFYCGIENDSGASNIDSECTGGPDDEESTKYKWISDIDTHYVRVTLNPEVKKWTEDDPDEPRYTIDLYFLPILNAVGITAPLEASTSASALAGRSFLTCNYPPLMICNPNENPIDGPASSVTLDVGQQVRLYMGATNGAWVPGDFGLLVPPAEDGKAKSGAVDIGEYLASEGAECTDPYVSTAPGGKVQQVKWGLNTRFGIYGHKYSQDDNKPAPNVLDYPRDSNLITDPDERIGNGNWRNPVYLSNGTNTNLSYWAAYHPAGTTEPDDVTTRYKYYMWESGEDYPNKLPELLAPGTLLPCDPVTDDKDCPATANIWDGDPSTADISGTNRRVISVPVLNCTSLGIKGSTPDIWVSREEYWKLFFITEHVDDPNGTPIIYAEYIGNVSDPNGTLRVEVKLYE